MHLGLLGDDLLLKPPLLLLRPLPQSLSGSCDLRASLLPGSAVVPQQLLDVRQTVFVSSLGVGVSGRRDRNYKNPEQRRDKVFVPLIDSSPGAVNQLLAELLEVLRGLSRRGLREERGLGTEEFAGTEAASSAGGLEMLLRLLLPTLDASAMSKRGKVKAQNVTFSTKNVEKFDNFHTLTNMCLFRQLSNKTKNPRMFCPIRT